MAEAVILSVIESLDCWLLMKEENNLEKLYSLIVGMSDLGEEKKEMVHTLLLKLGMKEEWERNKKELYNLLDLNKEKMYSLVVGMVDFLDDYKGKLYRLLFRVAERVVITTNHKKVCDKEKLHSLLVEITDMWGDEEGELNKEKLHSLLVEITDMWGDEEGELNNHSKNKISGELNNYSKKLIKEKLGRFLLGMQNQHYFSKKKIRMSGEVGGLWKDKQPKLNKEKLYTWLANKPDLHEPEHLFRDLLEMVPSYLPREGVEGTKTELGEILDLIRDKKLGEESSLRYFISDIVDMAHHARFLIQLQDSDPFALFFELSVLLQVSNHCGCERYYEWFDKKFEAIVHVLNEIKVSMLGFRVERFHNVRAMEGCRENVVGLEEDVKLLLNVVGNSETTVIAGMAGIGKTTLARQVYNHPTIAQQFERRAWACLSKVFSRKEMLVSLLRQLVDSTELASLEKIERADYESLKQVFRQQLLGMQYFIVLDDVWENTTHLEYVEKALPKDKRGSRLLITARNKLWGDYYFHDMKSMDGDMSWTLLLKTLSIEGCGEKFPKPLVKTAKQLLMRNCGGLPLAIKEVGRHWAKKRQSGSEWEELIESIDLTETLRVLESVYHNWDQKLKSRFLPLAFFKEGATIRAKKLVQIWRVMGLISRFKEMSQMCLRELSEESTINVIDMDKEGNIKRCCIHAVFHRLAIMKAEDELNFEILSKDGNNRPSHQPRHRAIYCSREKLMNSSSNQDKHLVSLFIYGGGYFNSWDHFEQLKTLDMEDFGLKILPDVIGMLSELRYLGLRNNYIQVLPHSLSCLKKLEVLDIALNFMIEVDDIIWEMDSLCHLYMSEISCRKPLRIDTLKSLETWTYVSVHNWTYEASRLKMMTSLTKLGIQEVDGNTDLSKLFASLAELENLKSLILRGFRFKRMPSLDEISILEYLSELKLDGLITRLPSAKNFPPNIRRLSLVNSCLHEDPMPILEKLSRLTYLKLQNAYTGKQMVIPCYGFSHLEFLVIEELWHLTNLQIVGAAMMFLKDLEINSCPNLDTLPEDYCSMYFGETMFKMKTTKKIATKIRESSFVSRFKKVDIQP